MTQKNEQQPLACDLTVFSASTRQEIAATTADMFQALRKVEELPDGYTFQFPNEPGLFMALANFVEHERQCCPFYKFALEVEPNGGPFWLRMTGGEGVKEFMQTTWRDLQGAVSKQLVKIGPDNDPDEAIEETAPVLSSIMEKAAPPSEGDR